MATYDVTWTITEEIDDEDYLSEEEKMTAAVEKAFSRLQAHGNDWYWKVKNLKTNKEFEVDFEFVFEQGPEITEIKTNWEETKEEGEQSNHLFGR